MSFRITKCRGGATAGAGALKAFLLPLLTAAAAAAHAGVYCSGYTAQLSVATPVPADIVGRPGGVAVWIMSPDEQYGAYLSQDGRWIYDRTPQYGDYRPALSMPASVTVSACVPDFARIDEYGEVGCAQATYGTAGWHVWIAPGGLTAQAEARVDSTQQRMADINASLVAQGRQPRPFDRQRWIEAEVLKNGRNNARAVLTVPAIDCSPPDTGGGD